MSKLFKMPDTLKNVLSRIPDEHERIEFAKMAIANPLKFFCPNLVQEKIIKEVGDVVPKIIEYERKARDFLVSESQENLHDRVSRAYGILRTAQTISSEETMHLLSSVRMGVNLGLIEDLEIPTVNELFIHTQPAHLQKLSGTELDPTDRNIERASYLQRHLRKGGSGDGVENN